MKRYSQKPGSLPPPSKQLRTDWFVRMIEREVAQKEFHMPSVPGPFVGKRNVYQCQKCRGHIVTVDVDSGVTPFMIRCRANFPSTCDGDMESAFYRVSQDLIPQYGWFRNPDGGEQLTLRRLDAVQREKYGERLRRG